MSKRPKKNANRRKSQPRKESIKAEEIKKEVAVTASTDLEPAKDEEVPALQETVKLSEENIEKKNDILEPVLEPKIEEKIEPEVTAYEEVVVEKTTENNLEEKNDENKESKVQEEIKEEALEVTPCKETEPVRYINIIRDKAIKLYSITKNGTEYKIAALLKDFAYEKDVKIRYTFDGWNTYKEEGMYYCSQGYDMEQLSSDRLQMWDKYFSIEDYKKENFEFVLYYGVNGYNYWDNNDEKNYKIEE
ncbi:MAG: carbohydrate-binding protein [Bacilli bacterium]|nr:carbohydrate-binding protein [Bacilli bacterium]